MSGARGDHVIEMIWPVIAESGECLIFGGVSNRSYCVWNAASGARCPLLEVAGAMTIVPLAKPGIVLSVRSARDEMQLLTFRDSTTSPVLSPVQWLRDLPLDIVFAGLDTKFVYAYSHGGGSGSGLTVRDKLGEVGELPAVAGRHVIQVTPGSGLTAGWFAVLWRRTTDGSYAWSVVDVAVGGCVILFDRAVTSSSFPTFRSRSRRVTSARHRQ